MKKLIAFMLLVVTIGASAQGGTPFIINKQIQITGPTPIGVASDSILTIRADGKVYKVPRSGIVSPPSDLQTVLATGSHAEIGSSSADILSVDKGHTFTDFYLINEDSEESIHLDLDGIRLYAADVSAYDTYSALDVTEGNILLQSNDNAAGFNRSLTFEDGTVAGYSNIKIPYKLGNHVLATKDDIVISNLDNVLIEGNTSNERIKLQKTGSVTEYLEASWQDGIHTSFLNGRRSDVNYFGFQTVTDATSMLFNNQGYIEWSNLAGKRNRIMLAKTTTGDADFYLPEKPTGSWTLVTTDDIKIGTTAPTSSTDTGTVGEIRVSSGFIYWCVNTNTWIRSAGATW
jgi:hypothetical protein